ncbi:hypothetical protein OHA37_39470 [Streptomyces sp. NBC_00335]|uniref:hypothetical protein n=1 Tax=unclassified Streptomyces TaxID=2593676 RepID=UPI0022565014|nr:MULTISPECIES: hypothetical protein [unclassified Streptomyces]MCX5409907.1 hypothetical protein [Streptomyces sp. NBC_00086]
MGWAAFGPLYLPTSKTSGPAVTQGQVARCYARTPRGAVLALVNISSRAANGPDWRKVVEQQVFPDASKNVFEQGTAAHRSGQPDYPAKSNRMVPAGYKLVTFTPDTAIVDIAYRNPGGTFTTVMMTARWHEGDWKQQMSPEGGISESVLSRFNTNGYTLFPQAPKSTN